MAPTLAMRLPWIEFHRCDLGPWASQTLSLPLVLSLGKTVTFYSCWSLGLYHLYNHLAELNFSYCKGIEELFSWLDLFMYLLSSQTFLLPLQWTFANETFSKLRKRVLSSINILNFIEQLQKSTLNGRVAVGNPTSTRQSLIQELGEMHPVFN